MKKKVKENPKNSSLSVLLPALSSFGHWHLLGTHRILAKFNLLYIYPLLDIGYVDSKRSNRTLRFYDVWNSDRLLLIMDFRASQLRNVSISPVPDPFHLLFPFLSYFHLLYLSLKFRPTTWADGPSTEIISSTTDFTNSHFSMLNVSLFYTQSLTFLDSNSHIS